MQKTFLEKYDTDLGQAEQIIKTFLRPHLVTHFPV